MNLDSYLSAERGRAAALAAELGVHQELISQWRKERRRVPAEHCPAIERATGGQVTCEELRPDIDWAVLRQPCSGSKTAPTHEQPKPSKGGVSKKKGSPQQREHSTAPDDPAKRETDKLPDGPIKDRAISSEVELRRVLGLDLRRSRDKQSGRIGFSSGSKER